MTKEERRALKFSIKTKNFFGLIEEIEVLSVDRNLILEETVKFKLKNGLKPKEHKKLAKKIRGAMFAYIRHELVVNYQEALKLLNYHPDRDNLYPILKSKTNKLIDKKYEGIKISPSRALYAIKKHAKNLSSQDIKLTK